MQTAGLEVLQEKKNNHLHTLHFLFEGPAGKLEAILEKPLTENKHNAVAVVCHPHPLHGGSMTNKVAHYIAKSFNEADVPALRFNFRGVGKSEGVHDNAIGEQKDLLAAIDCLQTLLPDHNLWLAGFSFGAYIALAMAYISGAEKLITVAPAVHLYDFNEIELPDCDWLLLQGDEDEIVPADEAIAWAENLANAPEIKVMHGAGHFFHGQLSELKDMLLEFIDRQYE